MRESSNELGPPGRLLAALEQLAATIDARAGASPEASYTAELLRGGPAKCAKKLGEEAVELAIALVSQSDAHSASETADLLYHVLVALRAKGVPLDAVAEALIARQGMSGLAEKASRPD
ncbi:MAG: phosphoribosyl-ATP diphosphatase [Pseudomonadota bacterium]